MLKPKHKTDPAGAKKPTAATVNQTRILVVDDHPVMREGLACVIEGEKDLMICGQAGTVASALGGIEFSKPDLAIVDISLGEQNALELIKDIKVRYPELPVLVHSMHDESIYAERSLRAGAKGYLMKQEPPEKLLVAIRRVLAGEIYLSEKMTKEVLRRTVDGRTGRGDAPLNQFSDREFEVFEMLGRGLGTRQISQALHLSPKTVQAHREHLKEKLQLKDSADLVRFALRWTEAQR